MPLPTGYGLQAKGPAGEDLLIPVCLPPGFELGSLVLRPSFLPVDEKRTASTSAPAAAPASVAPAPQRSSSERLAEAIQLVYDEEPAFRRTVAGSTEPVPERDRSFH
jgi:hypothetical protein